MDESATIELLERFTEAWNRHDADALMECMADECVFESSSGDEVCGTRYTGRDEVRAGFIAAWTKFPDAAWLGDSHFVAGDRGVSEWTFTGTLPDGSRSEVNGCDIYTFRDGRIAVKNSYRKNRPLISA